MRTPPSSTYTGLTVILDAPSRFDKEHLLSGTAADWFQESCLIPPHTLSSIDIRDLKCNDPLLPDTHWISLHGRASAAKFNGFNDPPGYPMLAYAKKAVATFHPQEANDHRNMSDEPDDDGPEGDSKDRSTTRRKNWRFWTQWHVRKLLSPQLLQSPRIVPITYPNLDEATKILTNTKGQDLYLDIETSRFRGCLTCIGFSTSAIFPKVFVVPVYLASDTLAYGNFHRFHRALSLAMGRNTVVAHNGAGFDFFVLRAFYKFPWPAMAYDTMLANHRLFPEAEKSLGHVISQWTNLPYHKDENVEPHNRVQDQQQWNYNAKDVYALKLIKDGQLEYAASDKGKLDSISQANASIVPYNDTSRIGMRLDQLKLADTASKLDTAKRVYQRIASILVNIPAFNPASPDQCAKYFHTKLNYQIVSRTETGKPALGSKQLYQLMLKYNNPAIPVILKYREVAKDMATLESELFEEP